MRPETVAALRDELARAREKFPGPHDATAVLVALFEEVGELARAFLEGDAAASREEAVQVAAVAIRIIEDTQPDQSSLWAANKWASGDRR